MKIFRRKDSKYFWVEFEDKAGNRVRQSTKQTDKKLAEREAVNIIYTHRPAKKTISSLDNIIDTYLKYSLANHTESTFKRNVSTINHFSEWYGERPKSELNSEAIEDYKQNRLLSVGRSTINREYNTLQSMFQKAKIWGKLEENPCDEVKRFNIKSDRKTPEFWSVREVDLILTKCKTYLHDMLLMTVYTGPRQTELIYMELDDINFNTWMLTIQAKDYLGWQPKSGRKRVVPIPKPCHKMLLERKAKSLSPFLFANIYGEPRRNNLNRDLRILLTQIGLYKKGIGWHTGRHTFASHLVMAGVPLKTVSELLGHADTKTTEIYAHLSPSHMKEAVDKLDYNSSARFLKNVQTKRANKRG